MMTQSYAPAKVFVDLYDLYTGPGSIAADLADTMGKTSGAAPLLVSTGSDLVLFPGAGAAPRCESFRHSTRGFKELTAISHLGTAVAWLVQMNEAAIPGWQDRARAVIAQCEKTRALCTGDHLRDHIRVAAWQGREDQIADMMDYAARVTIDFLAAGLRDPSRMSFAHLRDNFLEPAEGQGIEIPFNDVMVATFALTVLDIASRMIGWMRAESIDWPRAMVIIAGSSGRPTAGLTWATNNMCHQIWRASGQTLPPENLLIAPHLPGLDLGLLTKPGELAALEARYRAYWFRTRITADIGARMLEGFPAFQPSIEGKQQIGEGQTTISEMPSLRDPADRFTAITRLRMVMEDPRQLLSNCAAEFVVDELCAHDLDPAKVAIPGFTGRVFPRG
ncbi:MAG: DUF5624 domain-containing protein [Paracoccus sp. (in: a-proteobacteria)]|nr:DUF5624 domain-containing protein [Paracoccus sp. (in: a-proteobacteria)]